MSRAAWQRMAEVPHRAYFAAGVGSLVLLACWWVLALTNVWPSAVPSSMLHALIMPLGIFPPFMLGFVFTAGPRWLAVSAPEGHMPLALGHVCGLLLMLLGSLFGPLWMLPGLIIITLGWWRATLQWHQCIAAAEGDTRHAFCILFAMLAGNVALLLTAAWLVAQDGRLWLLCRDLIVWGWLVPIFLTVAHRMIPFFTQAVVPQRDVWRPLPLLWSWLAGCALIVLANLLGWQWLGLAASLAMAAAVGITCLRWAGFSFHTGLRGACGGNRLLAMLHLSLAWLPLALLLQAFGYAGVALGSAPLHAVGMGFCLTMMMGFVTRVTLGHSGRSLVPSALLWGLYLGLHGLAMSRVLLAILPASSHALHGVALLWLLVVIAWGWQVMPTYWTPRADGRPG